MLRILVKHARWCRNKRSRQARETESGPPVARCSTFSAISIWSWLSFQLKSRAVSAKNQKFTLAEVADRQQSEQIEQKLKFWKLENFTPISIFKILLETYNMGLSYLAGRFIVRPEQINASFDLAAFNDQNPDFYVPPHPLLYLVYFR